MKYTHTHIRKWTDLVTNDKVVGSVNKKEGREPSGKTLRQLRDVVKLEAVLSCDTGLKENSCGVLIILLRGGGS